MDAKPIRPIRPIGLAVLGSALGFSSFCSGIGDGFAASGAGAGLTCAGAGGGVTSAVIGTSFLFSDDSGVACAPGVGAGSGLDRIIPASG